MIILTFYMNVSKYRMNANDFMKYGGGEYRWLSGIILYFLIAQFLLKPHLKIFLFVKLNNETDLNLVLLDATYAKI